MLSVIMGVMQKKDELVTKFMLGEAVDTILKGMDHLISDPEGVINRRFDGVDMRLDKVEGRLDKVEGRLYELETVSRKEFHDLKKKVTPIYPA